jgi:hypothetical protein
MMSVYADAVAAPLATSPPPRARARRSARRRPSPASPLSGGHELLLGAAMSASYLCLPQTRAADALPAREAVLSELGVVSALAVAVFAVRRRVGGG